MGKYTPLTEYLRGSDGAEVSLSFREIERIIGAALPDSARKHQAWWANSRTADSHTWAHEWLAAGWLRGELDLAAETVVFRRLEHFEPDSREALEGYEIDRSLLAPARNAALAAKRKRRDGYTCQACGFFLEVDGRHVIEVHHLNPFDGGGERVTSVGDLTSLCPTCHRIAHLRSVPYSVAEIQGLRRSATAGAVSSTDVR